ncbi:MAG: 50S ribosomal protein L10 [Candidatus Pacearchaeota archaeon]|nr:50S ribosomal protein L10 [Candidatus Pacearchaeota archaeon]
MKEKFVRGKPIPEEKKKIVTDFVELMTNNRTILIASCKNLPGLQFHDIKKKLRGKALIKIARKTAVNRAIDSIDKGALKNLKKSITADFAILFSDLDPFELSGLLVENESAAKAKKGDIAPEEIRIEPGPTDLIAGPAISELSGAGLKVKVTEGKLEIIKGAVVAKKGEEIKANIASVLAKLGVSPMKVGFIPIAAYDSKEDKVYTEIIIDKRGVLDNMRTMIGKSLGFAVSIGYAVKETISYFIAKASAEEKALKKVIDTKKLIEQVNVEEKVVDNEISNQEDTKEENK